MAGRAKAPGSIWRGGSGERAGQGHWVTYCREPPSPTQTMNLYEVRSQPQMALSLEDDGRVYELALNP